MKKKTLFKLIITASCLLAACYLFSNQERTEFSKLAFQNIEALASGENDEDADCFGYGSVDCRTLKVEYKISGLSLE